MPVSATAIRSLDGDHAAATGLFNSPSAPPVDPNLPANAPSALNTCTRSLPVSATAIMPRIGAAGGSGGAKDMEYG